MAEQQSPTVEIAPTIIISNSNEGEENADTTSADNSSNADGSGEEAGGESELSSHSGADQSTRTGQSGELSSHNNGLSGNDSGSLVDETIADRSDDVAIAVIEAERDITLAAISDDTERERIRLEAERVEAITERNEEIEECRREIQELRERVETLTNSLIPPPLPETVMEEQLEIAPETNLIPQSTVDPDSETMTEASEESVEESPVEEIPNRVRRFIAI